MKKFFAYLFLFFFAFTSLQQASIVGMYMASQDFITEKFCVNKDKPALNCNGKCHMKDMIAETSQEQSDDAQQVVEVMIPVFYQESSLEMPSPVRSVESQSEVINRLEDSYESVMFQPPKA